MCENDHGEMITVNNMHQNSLSTSILMLMVMAIWHELVNEESLLKSRNSIVIMVVEVDAYCFIKNSDSFIIIKLAGEMNQTP